MNKTEPLIQARGLVKRFGGTEALKGVDLSVKQGEVHALVGENGAGKSTLGKCLAGVVRSDEGAIEVDGVEVSYRAPREALAAGITIVEQELALVPAMSVAANVFLGLHGSLLRPGRRRRAFAEVQELSDRFSLALDVRRPVERLSVAEQQKVEILRALSRGARVIVMDEPTARLGRDESENLLRIVKLLVGEGTAVVFVSHFLEEVLEVADRITVMRNGAMVRSGEAAGETPESLIESMLGRAGSTEFPDKRPVAKEVAPVLRVKNLSDGRMVHDVSLEVRPGEIVGLGGLVGSGRSEVARMIFGAERPAAGSIEIDGVEARIGSVRKAVSRGIAYLPESRKDSGLVSNLSAQENTTLAHLDEVTRWGMIAPRKERRETAATLERLSVNPPNPTLRVGALSGGNQQKVLFGKWLWRSPRLLIADEPTRGVDVGAKFAIYELLVSLAGEGMAILLISSEVEELIGLSHRIVVVSRGRRVAELKGEEVQEDRVLHAAFDSAPAPIAGIGS